MIQETTLYDAFTGMSPVEKSTVVRFLCEHTEGADRQQVRDAIEYAIKHKPSFGGFVLTVLQDRQIIATVVVNRTGMEGYNAKNLFVYVTFHKDYCNDEAMIHEVMRSAIKHADGEIALHIEHDNPALQLYKKLGFREQYLELRLDKTNVAVA